MKCSRCEREIHEEGLRDLCDACVAADPALFYSLANLEVVERRLVSARVSSAELQERGIGDDRLSNPTKGRGRLKLARADVAVLESSVSLIRSVLIDRGELAPNLHETLAREFPNAKNNEVVSWHGRRFRHRWVHEGMDRSGSNLWGREWIELAE